MNEKLAELVIKDVQTTMTYNKKILHEQKRYWLRYSTDIPTDTQLKIKKIVEERCFVLVRWIAPNEVEIEIYPSNLNVKTYNNKHGSFPIASKHRTNS